MSNYEFEINDEYFGNASEKFIIEKLTEAFSNESCDYVFVSKKDGDAK